MYKYYNPNLIRNQRFIKNDQKNHFDFPISVKSFVNNNNNLTKIPPTNNNEEGSKTNLQPTPTTKSKRQKRQSKCINYIIMFEDIMINQHKNIHN